jgi:hypothetical protein
MIKFCDNPKCDHHVDYDPFRLDYLRVYKGNQVKEIYNYKYYTWNDNDLPYLSYKKNQDNIGQPGDHGFGCKVIHFCEICASAVDMLKIVKENNIA